MTEIEEYKKYIRKYPTDQLLEFFSKKSIESYQKDGNGYTLVDVPYYNQYGRQLGIHKDFMYGQWELVEICYDSIKYGNDYRNTSVDDNVFYHLINYSKKINEILESKSGLQEHSILSHLICISNVQFEFQSHSIINQFNRIYHMMTSINTNSKFNQTNEVCYINLTNKFKEITNFEYNKFVSIYLVAILLMTSVNNPNIYDVIKNVNIDKLNIGFSEKEMLDVIKYLSREYSFYKDSNNWNLLRYYPIVQTKRSNKLIVTNIYAMFNSFAKTTYWILRNHYNENNSKKFLTYFGYCFECYVQELFDKYKIKYEKIPRGKFESPDWKIETEKYTILIEQKSALLPIDAHITTKEERYTSLEKYIANNIKKAFKQLDSYNTQSKKTTLRLCLVFETIYFEETVEEIALTNFHFSDENDKDLNWIININDFEKLMYLIFNNENKFNEIITEKIKLSRTKSNEGRGFDKLLSKEKNNYIRTHINHFEKITKDLLKKIKPEEN